FMCDAGRNAGRWATIPVPSNWELHGFGTYNYGREPNKPLDRPRVTGHYKRTFTLPAAWTDKRIRLIFEGAMTDTAAFINGQSAGPKHQGGFYRFQYDITPLLKPGENLLEVTVDDESADASVNTAERRGDYWNFGGIYRPVYLQALPPSAIDHVAINAQADGTLTTDVTLTGQPIAAAESFC